MLYVGLDVHSKQSSPCILNAGGGTVNPIQLNGLRSAVVERLKQLYQPFSICYEASYGYWRLNAMQRMACPEPGRRVGRMRRRCQSPDRSTM